MSKKLKIVKADLDQNESGFWMQHNKDKSVTLQYIFLHETPTVSPVLQAAS